jgi:hypothetical protein
LHVRHGSSNPSTPNLQGLASILAAVPPHQQPDDGAESSLGHGLNAIDPEWITPEEMHGETSEFLAALRSEICCLPLRLGSNDRLEALLLPQEEVALFFCLRKRGSARYLLPPHANGLELGSLFGSRLTWPILSLVNRMGWLCMMTS